MRIKKTSQVTPVPTEAQIVDGYSESSTDAYSCKYINDLHSYINTEQVIGTWINGKPIYRKIFTGNTNTSGSYENSLGTISNVDEVIRMDYIFGIATNVWSGALTTDVFCGGNVSSGTVKFFCKPRSSSYPCRLIVEYTKTTDTATT